MLNISCLISLPVVSIYDVRLEGIIENVLINKTTKKLEWLVIYDEENDLKKVVPFNKVYSINNNGISIKNSSCINLFESIELQLDSLHNPINSYVYSFDDGITGRVKDIQVNNGHIENFIIDNKLVPHSMILSFTNQLTIIKQKQTQKLSNFSYKKIRISKLLEIDNNTEHKVNILDNSNKEIYVPKKAVVNYNFLINRTTTKDISTSSGEVIVKKDSVITLNLIDNIRKNGKLKELTLYSK